jgi:hypothetical protein
MQAISACRSIRFGSEIEDQMQYFAEEVSPLIARASGGQRQNPEVNTNLDRFNAK